MIFIPTVSCSESIARFLLSNPIDPRDSVGIMRMLVRRTRTGETVVAQWPIVPGAFDSGFRKSAHA